MGHADELFLKLLGHLFGLRLALRVLVGLLVFRQSGVGRGGKTIFRDMPLGDSPAGIPCPGEFRPADWEDTVRVDILEHPSANFALRVRGDSMIGRDIHDGDILLFAQNWDPAPGNVVVCCIDGEVTIKTLVKTNGRATLKAENPAYPDPVGTKNSAIQGVMGGKLALPKKRRAD